MIWFLSEIWPRIQARLGNEVTLTIAGINKSERISAVWPELQRADRWPSLSGYDRSVQQRSRVFIAPTRFAAGIPAQSV